MGKRLRGGFLLWEIKQGLIPCEVARWGLDRYAEYKDGKRSEEQNCIDSIIFHNGLSQVEIERAASQFVKQRVVPRIFPEMKELVRRLAAMGCEVWAVSSTNVWVVRAAALHCSIPEDRVLATCVVVRNGRLTDQLIRVPTSEGKVRVIREVIGDVPDSALGTPFTIWPCSCLRAISFAINPDWDLEQIARKRC